MRKGGGEEGGKVGIANTVAFNRRIVLGIPEPSSLDQDFQSKLRAQCISEYPGAGAGTRFYTLVSGSSCPFVLPPVHGVSRMCCFLWMTGRSLRLERRRWLFRFYLSTKKTTTLSSHFRPDTHMACWGKSHTAEKCHYFPALWPSTVCSVSRGWSKGELGTGDRCLLKFSQDSRATRTLFKDVALPLGSECCLFCQC